ncbi:MAG: NERD domain-containing protein [Planctomycetaceae bacterium]|nr:NERD domain-containing protein [Planctomycetaceae bacterium]
MRITIVPCGEVVNESEAAAIDRLKRELQNIGTPTGWDSDDEWILLTNLAFSVTHQFQSDDIDIIAIGPPGVRVIEVKHWSVGWCDASADLVAQEADKLTLKARKIGTTLRRVTADLPRVDGTILLTRQPSKVRKLVDRGQVRGVSLFSLNQWKQVVGFEEPRALTPNQVRSLAKAIEPKSAVRLEGSLRRLAGYVNLEQQTPKDERFHRIYCGSHPTRRDKVILHLYDLSVSDEAKAEARARREAEALQRLQLYPWAPRILDSFQDAPGYAGEMYFFTVADPAAPTLHDRVEDVEWAPSARALFAREAIRALAELHESGDSEDSLVHRNLTPNTILVRYDNTPIFTGFDRTRIPSDISVASSNLPTDTTDAWIAPEVISQGLSAADQRSDIYSLCVCLSGLFADKSDSISSAALEILATGQELKPDQRTKLVELERSISELLGDSVAPLPAPPARFWTEDQVVRFHGRDYRIVSRLGSGGIGTTFKVVELDRSSQEELGTYVAKIVHDGDTGKRVLKSYSLVRSHLVRQDGLSPIFEVAREWQENEFVSLLGWIDGTPLSEFTGVFPLLAENQDEPTPESLAVRWLTNLSEALDVLHRNGLTHGDVSPRNMIVSGSSLVLTDYDFVSRLDDASSSVGTVSYCSPERQQKKPSTAADDLFALAASFFHVLFEKEPFRFGGELAKERGLNWDGVERSQFPVVAEVLDKATHKDHAQRFASAGEMLQALTSASKLAEDAQQDSREDQTQDGVESKPGKSDGPSNEVTEAVVSLPTAVETVGALSEQRVDWLKSLLQSYPGSRWGNRETRGLDTTFASDTYVPTALEESLLEAIRTARVRLVILCGNAGDGKTALLQHLALELGLGRHQSVDRILEGRVPNGPRVRMNLDGSAAWQGKSADQLLDEFLAPFQDGAPSENIVHLLAINDGRLLEWIEGVEGRLGRETELTAKLYELLQERTDQQDSQIRFISLNQRSLVGGITAEGTGIDTEFLERLLDHLYGGRKSQEKWSPCQACSAKERCHVYQAARIFGPDSFPSSIPDDVRKRSRQRLFEALQAVHLRGETHITVRELRAALVYVLFGVHFCDDYHSGEYIDDRGPLPYWDRAFSADSQARQGEVLREIARFDPALESHPQIDRYLLSQPVIDSSRSTPRYPGLSLESARRRAFFEWTDEDLRQVLRNMEEPSEALDLARGSHIREFRRVPLIRDASQLADITRRLCAGISRLEDLPPQAFERSGVVPFRITPRTPTETAFWVEKPMENFRIEPVLPSKTEGIERLHRQVALTYHYRDGNEERLLLGAELFHLLLELAEGYQLGDVSTDDTFAHLSIFVQRLVREDERELLAWNPMQDEQLYRIAAIVRDSSGERKQELQINEISSEVTS